MYHCRLTARDGCGNTTLDVTIRDVIDTGAACDGLRQCSDIKQVEISSFIVGHGAQAPSDLEIHALRVCLESPLLLVRAAAALEHIQGASLSLWLPPASSPLASGIHAFWLAWLEHNAAELSRFTSVSVRSLDQ